MWVIGDGLPYSRIIITAAKKPAAPPSKSSEMAVPSESGGDMGMPALVCREGRELVVLELFDGGGGEVGGFGHGDRLTVIVGPVSKPLGKVAIRVVAVTGLFCHCTISRKISGPG